VRRRFSSERATPGCEPDLTSPERDERARGVLTRPQPDVEEMLRRALAQALEVIGADAGAISLLDETTGRLAFRTRQGWRTSDSGAEGTLSPPDQGMWDTVVATGQPWTTHCAHDARGGIGDLRDEGVQAVMLAPIRAGDRVLGALGVMSHEPRDFDQREVALLLAMADQIGIGLDVAIENAQLYDETRQRLEELIVLDEVALAVTSKLDLEEIVNCVSDVVRKGLGSEALEVLLVEGKGGSLRPLGWEVRENAAQTDRAQDGVPDGPVGQGLVSWVAEHGTVVRVGDTSQDPRCTAVGSDARSALVVPLIVGDRVIGVVNATSPHLDAFSSSDERLMTTVARQLVFAIENARLHQETEWRLAEVSALYELARQINTSLNVQDVLDSIVWSLKQAVGCRGCSIALLDPVDDVLEIRAAAGIEDRWKRDFQLKLGEGIAGRVALDNKPMYVPDVLELGDFIFFDAAVRSLLTVPLCIQHRVIGTLSVDSDRPHAFSEADERLLTIAAAQAAVAIERARLYANLQQRARNLAEAYTELKEADRLKDEVVQNVSHELRTPLTFVKGYVQLLLEGNAGGLTEAQKEYLRIVAEKTDVITALVSDIMFLQQADRAPGNKTPVSLTKLAWRALRGCAATAEKAELTLVENLPKDLPPVAGNEARLLQVFDNLLGNAIKFSPAGGRITVTVEDAGSMLRASVSDQGIGIPKDQQEKIFERFYQVNGSARRRFGGAGLGLAIVRQIVETHGGRVWVESDEGKGSTFYFTIPKCQDPIF